MVWTILKWSFHVKTPFGTNVTYVKSYYLMWISVAEHPFTNTVKFAMIKPIDSDFL